VSARLRLSVLDQSPIPQGSSGARALGNTLDLAGLADRLGYHRYWVAEHHGGPMLAGPSPEALIGPIAAAVGLALLAFADFGKPYWASVFPAICVLAAGMTITVPPLTSTVMGSVGEAHAGIASGINNAVARVAGLLAVAALGAVLFASFSDHLAGLPPAHVNQALNAVQAGEAGVPADALAAFDRALRTVMLVTSSCALLAGIAGWLWIRPIGPEPRR